MAIVIGVDFDNTIVRYDALLQQVAAERGLIEPAGAAGKREIRDRIRRLPEGEIAWQAVQGIVYGPRAAEASLADGIEQFFARAKAADAAVYIISHKTEYATVDRTRTNLREAALTWMRQHRFFEEDGLGLSPSQVFFESTRQEKIERIRRLGCTHFIDDLEETFLEAAFPSGVAKILYAPDRYQCAAPGVAVVGDWVEAARMIFERRAIETDRVDLSTLGQFLGMPITACDSITGGRNSRLYKVVAADGRL